MEDFSKPIINEKKDEAAPKESWVSDVFWITVITLLFLLFLDLVIIFGGETTGSLFIRKDCDFQIPKGYAILSDGRYFVVQKDDRFFKKVYLSQGVDEILDFPLSIRKPKMFRSECKARGFLKKYLSQQNKLPGFKDINAP